ncbi:MAG: T9SS type A sorting domain-containing protein [Flavobacteriales bacterium]|nr:T9SS type A sorting domain-containing protein [Flavobacteriales bacterium]
MNKTIRALWKSGLMAIGLLVGATVSGQNSRTIATNLGTSGNGPMGTAANHAGEYIYLASEIGGDMTITGINFAINAGTLTQTFGSVNLYLKTVGATSTLATGVYSTAGYTLVYTGPMVWTTNGFAGVPITPFAYTLAAGNLELLVTRTEGVTHAGVSFMCATGNAVSGGAALTCRRFNGAGAPVSGTTSLTQSNFRAAIQLVGNLGPCGATFPQDFSSTFFPPDCYETSHAWDLRNAANGFAAAGTGSVLWQCFSAPVGQVMTLSTPTFTPFGVPKQLNFDVAGAEFTGNASPDQLFVEASTDGGLTWPITLASMTNAIGGALNPLGTSITTGYVPTTAAEWATRSFIFSGTVNRIRWRGVSAFGNNFFADNITVTDPPSCLEPSAVAISNIASTSADVSWACAGCTGTYIVEYGVPGFVPGSGASVGGGLGIVPSAGLSATIPGLTGSTPYDVHVRQECTPGVSYSTNTPVTSFFTLCSGASCNYSFHLTDNYGDSWNGAQIEVKMNGGVVTTLELVDPCEATVSVPLCEGATIELVVTNLGAFPDEVGMTMFDPFGGVLYEQRGTSFYPGNCPTTYPNPGVPADLTLGLHFSTIGNCTPPPCVDPPVAGTISATASVVCTGTTSTLTMSNGGATGLTRQWQESSTGILGSWTNIGGATNQSYTTAPLLSLNYYRFYLDCGAGSDTSAGFLVDVNLLACYCTPVHTFDCFNGNIVNVTLNTLANPTVCNTPAYEAFPQSGATTTSLERGVTYPLGVTSDANCIISVWADWDHNNVFDTYEWTQVALSTTANTAVSVGLSVPLSAVLGTTPVRIRSRFSGNLNGPTNACGAMGSGEAEDYLITVTPEPACLPASALVFSNVSQFAFDVNWTNGANSCGTATYVVEYGPAGFVQGTGTSLPAVLAGPVSITGLLAATQYDVYVTRDCTPCGDGPGLSSSASVVTYPDCATAQPINCPSGVGLFGANSQGAWNFVEPLFGFTTVGAEQLFSLSASVLGTYSMSLTANAGNSIVAIYIKDQTLGCDANNWTYVGTNQFTVQSFNFPIVATGNYYVLVDPVSSGLDISTYIVTFVCPVQNIDCSTAEALVCGSSVQSSTAGLANTLPPTACTFVNASTGGSVWYSFTSPTAQEVTVSTCGIAQFDTRLSVFLAAPDCSTLQCVALNDDGTGCPNFSSEASFLAAPGSLYYIAVHGFGADEGFFQMAVICAPPCTPATTNDACSTAEALTPALDDGSGVPTPGSNECAHGDQNTGCDAFGAMQGVWYSFNSGPNSIMFMDLLTFTQNPLLVASDMSYALYDGGCDGGLGALNELDCAVGADGFGTVLPALVPNTNYLLNIWNDGANAAGSFSILLRRPGMDDAAIDTILQPDGSLCTTVIVPEVRLRNNGENPLTSATITYDIDGGTPQVFLWTGNLAYQQTEDVTLPSITSPSIGVHVLNVASSLPNGAADAITANDSYSKSVNITGESVIVAITTDNNGGQISWTILDAFAFPVASGGPYAGQNNQLIPTTVCLPTNFGSCYTFSLLDAGGDGLCCLAGNGSWELRTLTNAVLLRDLFNSTPNGSNSPSTTPTTLVYGSGHQFCLPAGPSPIVANECAIFTNTLSNKVYTTLISGVLNYQFEFSDPDAGFYRRITVPRNWVKFSEMVTSPLTPGVVYFARARADVGLDGVSNDNFGAGCEMALDVNQVPGCTQLINDISLPTHSCGVSKPFGGSGKIWAVPVLGGTQYRFRFVNVGEGYARNIVRPSYVCLLSWTQFPLVNGSTYDVTVEVFVNGVWGGFCGATCQVTVVNPPASVSRTADANTLMMNDAMTIFPNPTRDGNATVVLNGLSDMDHAISVEVYDMFGKRVISQQQNTSGVRFSTLLELDRTNASGIYLVNVTVDGVMTTQRLSVL